MNLAPGIIREPRVLDALGATGGVYLPEARATGLEEHSLEGRVKGLTISSRPKRVYFIQDNVPPTVGWYGVGVSCLGLADVENSSMEPAHIGWKHVPISQELTATGCSYFFDASLALALEKDRQWWGNRLRDLPSVAGATVVDEPVETVESAELIEIVQQIRDATKLPVNDLSAMLGIKRRQFYNWLDGTMPPSDRIRRLFALRDAVSRLADAADGDPRRVRVALLAPISGDSVFDAFTGEDPDRIERAVDTAVAAVQEGRRLPRRVPRSARPSAAPGAADELRFERDSLGLLPDTETDDES